MSKPGKLKQAVQEFKKAKLQWGWSRDDLVADFDIPGEFAGTLRIEDRSHLGRGCRINVENDLGISQVIEDGTPDLPKAILRAEALLFDDFPNAKPK